MNTKSKGFDPEFKERAIRLALSSSQSISKTAKELGIKETTLYFWVKEHKKRNISNNTPDNSVNVYAQLAQVRKENARLKEERDILKKAAAWFANQSERGTNS